MDKWDSPEALQKWRELWSSPGWALALRFMEERARQARSVCLSLDPSKEPGALARAQGQEQVWSAFVKGDFQREFTDWLTKETEE